MLTNDFRIAKVQRTLRWFEEDIPLLNMRVKELSKERQESARQFAAALIDETRAELERLLQERPQEMVDAGQAPCEPAD
jgi:primosomal protein N''